MVTVLYVDDIPVVLDNAILLLKGMGHTVRGAGNGQEGLEILAEEGAIDIIFSDYQMPVMNGYDFSRAAKTDPRYARHSGVPIVGVGDFPHDKREFLAECLPKPIIASELLRCIEKYCR